MIPLYWFLQQVKFGSIEWLASDPILSQWQLQWKRKITPSTNSKRRSKSLSTTNTKAKTKAKTLRLKSKSAKQIEKTQRDDEDPQNKSIPDREYVGKIRSDSPQVNADTQNQMPNPPSTISLSKTIQTHQELNDNHEPKGKSFGRSKSYSLPFNSNRDNRDTNISVGNLNSRQKIGRGLSISHDYPLHKYLSVPNGYELIMSHLIKEFAFENLLAFTEFIQFKLALARLLNIKIHINSEKHTTTTKAHYFKNKNKHKNNHDKKNLTKKKKKSGLLPATSTVFNNTTRIASDSITGTATATATNRIRNHKELTVLSTTTTTDVSQDSSNNNTEDDSYNYNEQVNDMGIGDSEILPSDVEDNIEEKSKNDGDSAVDSGVDTIEIVGATPIGSGSGGGDSSGGTGNRNLNFLDIRKESPMKDFVERESFNSSMNLFMKCILDANKVLKSFESSIVFGTMFDDILIVNDSSSGHGGGWRKNKNKNKNQSKTNINNNNNSIDASFETTNSKETRLHELYPHLWNRIYRLVYDNDSNNNGSNNKRNSNIKNNNSSHKRKTSSYKISIGLGLNSKLSSHFKQRKNNMPSKSGSSNSSSRSLKAATKNIKKNMSNAGGSGNNSSGGSSGSGSSSGSNDDEEFESDWDKFDLFEKLSIVIEFRFKAYLLYKKYIARSAEFEINIKSLSRELFSSIMAQFDEFLMYGLNDVNLNNLKNNNTYTSEKRDLLLLCDEWIINLYSLFDDACTEVYTLMKYSFQRFKSSKTFEQEKERLKL